MDDSATFSLDDLAGSRFPLLEYAPDATIVVDAEGKIRLVNAHTERLFGYYREELIGHPIEMLIPARYRSRHVGERKGYYGDPHVRPMGVGLELNGLRKNGTEFPVEISLAPVLTVEGTFVSCSVRDASELKELNTALETANRAKDQFLASMSHELRTPLNAIIGFTGTLLMRIPGELNDEQERQLEIVQSSARHLLSLINDILDLAKIESGKIELAVEEIAVHEVVDEVAASLAALAAQKRLDFSTHIAGITAPLATDRRALAQILLNLANNALKYTEAGSVRIDVWASSQHGRDAVAFSVSDTGIGIKSEDQERLFMAFEQVDRSATRRFEGTGLGLYLCRNLAQMLGGELSVTSVHGRGSTFTLTLPHR
jgi:PAS domain S-box-containing protein